MNQSLIYVILLISNIQSREISKYCKCGHIDNKNDCQNSLLCQWVNSSCKLKENTTYIQQSQNDFKIECYKYAQEDCIQLNECGFHLGECIDFKECSIFQKNQCQESSNQCIFDGQKCIQKEQCENYKTQIACSYTNNANQYCFWNNQQQCQLVQQCNQLPYYLTTNIDCQNALDYCTVNDQGYGCQDKYNKCNQYLYENQCFEIKNKNVKCFWDNELKKCFEMNCENKRLNTHNECNNYLSKCTTNGINCIQINQCQDIKNQYGCIIDIINNKCIFYNNQCQIKTCYTAPIEYNNYYQCQEYEPQFDCVTQQNGGCKNRPLTCQGYNLVEECYSIKQQDCIWYQNKCEQRNCQHAPIHYTHQQCIQYGYCMGQLQGGCQIRPQNCNEIINQQYCDINYNKQNCMWQNNQCIELKCQNFKLPNYNNHQTCNQANKNCTFNIQIGSCDDYICTNATDQDGCTIDSLNNKCKIMDGCINKKCILAPSSYNTHQQCINWLSKCTINIYKNNGQIIYFGCIDKLQNCNDYLYESQCISTIDNYKCIWTSQICEYSICEQANIQECIDYKFKDKQCIESIYNQCIQQPTDCLLIKYQSDCIKVTSDNKKCKWKNNSCSEFLCEDIQINGTINNINCNNIWNKCMASPDQTKCINKGIQPSCQQSPHTDQYSNHQQCNAWNNLCTISDNNGCTSKQSNCSDYKTENECSSTVNNKYCYWNYSLYKCIEAYTSDCSEFVTQTDCQSSQGRDYCLWYNNKCILPYSQNCIECTTQNDCESRTQGICIWDTSNSKCKLKYSINFSAFRSQSLCEQNNLQWMNNQCYYKYIQKSDCYNKIIGGLSHENCEAFLPNCTVNNLVEIAQCITLQPNCSDYIQGLNCKVNFFQQQCEWDSILYKCIDLSCDSNIKAINEVQCYEHKNSYECELIYNEFGIPQKGCQNQQISCNQINSKINCNKTILKNGDKCVYYNDECIVFDGYCYKITDSNTNSQCQYYNRFCLLQSSGFGCYLINDCSLSDLKQCSNNLLQYNYQCKLYQQQCKSYDMCDNFSDNEQNCKQYKTNLNVKCNYINNKCVPYECTMKSLLGTTLSKYQQCQQRSSLCTYNNELDTCIEIDKCTDLDKAGQLDYNLCNNSVTNLNQKCGYDFNSNQCKLRKCEQLSTQQLQYLSDLDCYNWNSNCILKDDKCIQFNYNDDCSLIKIPQQCLQYTYCYLQDDKCTKQINCSINQTALTNFECQLISSNCYLDLYNKKGCAINNCNNILDQSICDESHTYDKIECKYSNKSSICEHKTCKDYDKQQQKCEGLYGYETVDTYKIKTNCYWFEALKQCSNSKSQRTQEISSVNDSIKTNIITQHSNCHQDHFMKTVYFIGPKCVPKKPLCSDYFYESACKVSSKGIKCRWIKAQNQCDLHQSCNNYSKTSHKNCFDEQPDCMFNGNNGCIVLDCLQLSIKQDCDIFELNCTWDTTLGKCQNINVLQTVQQCCVDLKNSCEIITNKEQCYSDISGSKCFYTGVSCLSLNDQTSCSIIQYSQTTHEYCQSLLDQCTVNNQQTGCQELYSCELYTEQYQCKINTSKQQCEWMKISKECVLKQCNTAQLNQYSAGSCQTYYDNTCTVNKDFNQCELAKVSCQMYFEKQCNSNNQMNIYGELCYWNIAKQLCLEQNCEYGIQFAANDFECELYKNTCQKGGCIIKDCIDYYYGDDFLCASLFDNSKCTTNGFNCVKRQMCEDMFFEQGCTFDINFNECIWTDNQCKSKSCDTAPITYTTNDQCLLYLDQQCVLKKDNGCMQIEECSNNQLKESCVIDKYKQGCIWDDYLQECYSDICEGFCGDGLITNQFEECDDGNYLPYDGCYKCKIQCSQGCLNCKGKICLECNPYGWLLNNEMCHTICGDGIVLGQEQCDDGNLIEYDGCFNCQYQCDKYCLNCYQGQCVQCPDDLYLNGSYCLNKCGDGIFQQYYEQCDDGNLNNHDGCDSNCQIEQFWQCNYVDNVSHCIYFISPKIILSLKNQNNNGQKQVIILTFSEPVKLIDQLITEEIFIQLIKINILDMNQNDYQVTINPIFSITQTLSYVSYQIIIQFYKQQNTPILLITINCDSLVNEYNNTLFKTTSTIQLKDPFLISDTQKIIAAKATLFNQVIIYTLIIVGCIAFISGNMDILWNLLDTLQQLSYMKYFNITFPENIAIYFEVFGLVSFQPIYNLINVDYITQSYFNYQIPFISAKFKFELFKLNSFFGVNFSTFLIISSVGLLYYITSYIILWIMNYVKYYNWPIIVNEKYINSITKIIKIIYSLQRFFQSYVHYFFYSGIIRIYLSNYYDLTFSALLQLQNFTSIDKITTINSYGALLILAINIGSILFFFSYLTTSMKIPIRFSILLEGIDINLQKKWNRIFIPISLLKKQIFIINLILLQELPSLQTCISSMLSGLYVVYIYNMMPFQQKFENYKIIISESLIAFNCLLFSLSQILFQNSLVEYLSVLGWIQIIGFTIILINSLLFDLTQSIKKPIQYLFKKCQIQPQQVQKITFELNGLWF